MPFNILGENIQIPWWKQRINVSLTGAPKRSVGGTKLPENVLPSRERKSGWHLGPAGSRNVHTEVGKVLLARLKREWSSRYARWSRWDRRRWRRRWQRLRRWHAHARTLRGGGGRRQLQGAVSGQCTLDCHFAVKTVIIRCDFDKIHLICSKFTIIICHFIMQTINYP